MAARYGAEVYARPPQLATDEALVIDAIKDLLARLQAERGRAEWVILLEPTCPLRSADDVRKCLELVAQGRYDSVATFKEADLNPHRAWRLVEWRPRSIYSGCRALAASPETPQCLSVERRRLYISRRFPCGRSEVTLGGKAWRSAHAA